MKERSTLCESHAEEVASAISHGIGAVLSFIGLLVMFRLAIPLSVWHVVGVSVFGSSLVLLYSASTIYHAVASHGRKRFFQIVDHILIYVLIAGSYTPWLLVNLRGPWGWSLLAVVWSIALTGTILKVFRLRQFEKISTALYVAMGWLVCVALKPMVENVNPTAIAWLVAGGLCYTGGVLFYVKRGMKFAHFTWHLFVMAGSFCHFIAVVIGVLGQ